MLKRLLTILFFLSLVATGAYCFFETSLHSGNFVEDLLPNEEQGVDSLINFAPTPQDSKDKKTPKSKIPKTIKPDEFHSLDEYARKTPKQNEINIKTLANYLIIPANTDMEKVRVIFTWIATHIKYDSYAFNSGRYPRYTPEYVLVNKKAVCEGYSNLFKALCEAAGLEAQKIIGYAKGYGYKIGEKMTETNHAWNAVKINDTWHLFDVTWASGFGTNKNGMLVSTSRFEPYWFDVNPKAFVFTHFPQDPNWQLIENSITLSKYFTMPYLTGSFFKLGFDPNKIYNEVMYGKLKEFVDTYDHDYPLMGVQLPYSKKIIRDSEIKFEIQSDYAEKIALVDGYSWNYFTKEGNTFTIKHKPKAEELEICVKINWFDPTFKTVAKYKVINSR